MNESPPPIPLVDLRAQYGPLAAELQAAVAAVMERADFILGDAVSRFEEELARFCGASYAVGVANGTDAIELACRAIGLEPGDEVIVPAMTFIATALGVSFAGGRPVLADVDADTALVDPDAVRRAVTPRTRAILPVHLFGHCAAMDELRAIAHQRGLHLIEDAAQAHGATHAGRRAGALAEIGCFSFYPGKNLGAYGDGGAVVTSDAAIADRLRLLRNWGSHRKYHHEEIGKNSRLDTLQAAILRVKLPHLDAWNAARRAHAARYDAALADVPGVRRTRYREGCVYHLYVIRVRERERALAALHAAGIGAGIHYPFAVHELAAYRSLGYAPGAFPNAEHWARHCLSLPMYAELPESAPERAAAVLRAARLGDAP